MNLKKKLILIGICVAIILIVFIVNVMRRMKVEPEKEPVVVVKENIITRGEAYRLLSYLDYDKASRDSLSIDFTYVNENMSDWYDTYVNAVWKMGLIENNVTITPKEALTYGSCKILIDNLILKKTEYQNVYAGLSFEFTNAEEEMPIKEFIELYEVILAATLQKENPIQKKTLFVLGREVSEDGKDRMVTDSGKYYYLNAKNYETYYKEKDDQTKEALADGKILAEAENISKESIANTFLDKGIHVLVRGQEIIYITSETVEKIILRNVWIQLGKGRTVDTFISGIHKNFDAKFSLSNDIEKVVGDITIEDRKVVQISVKPDLIHGKVLQTGEDFIEIEGYGKVPLEKEYKIYKIYGEITQELTGSILVGYEATDFVVSGGKISAALITESIKAENIRVLLKTTDFKSIYHDKVEFTSNSDFTVSSKEKETSYTAGEIVTVELGEEMLSNGRIKITTTSDQGKIELLSVTRDSKNPKYRGNIEIAEAEKGLLIVNELPLEEYLYAVIPSEMPTYYGMEPLKVQAVCARSYAYKHLLANSLSEYGAHVDDSVSYQVYNNIAENEDSILAVKDTYGKVVKYEEDVITAYYFSTSCGHTTGVQSVWANGEATPYLSGKLMALEVDKEGTKEQLELMNSYQDLADEENFRSFLNEKEFETYDSEFDWYRWNVTIDAEDIKEIIDKTLLKRYNANPDLIQTMTKAPEDGKEAVFESIPIETVGDIEDVSVLKRETGGIISELLIKGSKNTIKVKTEYNIRVFLAPTNSIVIRNDLSEVGDLSLLPSAFFVVDEKKEGGKLLSISLLGGGYGHGVGMSQNGVKALADAGKEYEEIITYFYEGTKMGFIYE